MRNPQLFFTLREEVESFAKGRGRVNGFLAGVRGNPEPSLGLSGSRQPVRIACNPAPVRRGFSLHCCDRKATPGRLSLSG
jgi:hypothetical protein